MTTLRNGSEPNRLKFSRRAANRVAGGPGQRIVFTVRRPRQHQRMSRISRHRPWGMVAVFDLQKHRASLIHQFHRPPSFGRLFVNGPSTAADAISTLQIRRRLRHD